MKENEETDFLSKENLLRMLKTGEMEVEEIIDGFHELLEDLRVRNRRITKLENELNQEKEEGAKLKRERAELKEELVLERMGPLMTSLTLRDFLNHCAFTIEEGALMVATKHHFYEIFLVNHEQGVIMTHLIPYTPEDYLKDSGCYDTFSKLEEALAPLVEPYGDCNVVFSDTLTGDTYELEHVEIEETGGILIRVR